jgi:nucleotide-binding universal stress UspA family protein
MRVLISIDDSAHSRAAVDVVLSRAWPEGTEFRVVNVAEPAMKDGAGRLLEGVQDQLKAKFPNCIAGTDVLGGSPTEQILNECKDWKADLVVMGTRGNRGIKRVVLGSVSQAVLLDADVSVLIVTADGGTARPGSVKNILVAVDDSEHSEAALNWLRKFPQSPDIHTRVMTVSKQLAEKYSDGFSAIYSSAAEMTNSADKRAAEVLLKKSATALGVLPGDSRMSMQFCEGEPADQIVAMAKSWPADLIVMGSRGLKGVSKFWQGSVSENVVLNAPCPVEIVK